MGARTFTPHSEAFESVPAPDEGPVVRPVIRPGRAREAAALCLFALAAFLVLSLGTYAKSIGDPSVRGENWTGPAGEFLAGILVQGFGIAAWLVPVELSLIGAPLFRGKELGPVGLRLAGDLVVAVIVAALVQVAVPDATAFGNMPGAGNVGLLFGELMRGLFSTVGSFLVGGTLIGLILIGRSTFSFIAWIQRVASLARGLAWRVASTARRVALAWRQARSLRKEQTGLSHELRIETRGTDEAIIAQLEEDEADWPSLDTTDSPPLAMATSLREVDVGLAFLNICQLRNGQKS